METNQFALYKGKIVYVPDVPEKPSEPKRKSEPWLYKSEKHFDDWDLYKTRLQSAIAAGIEVENWDSVRWKRDDIKMEEGKLYTLQCRVEIVCQFQYSGSDRWIDCDVSVYQEYQQKDSYGAKSRKVARVTFEQPKQYREMDIRAPKETKVIYTGKNGYDSDKEHADKYLKVGEIYTIDRTDVHSWYTRVYLKEVPGQDFNSVHFVTLEQPEYDCQKHCGNTEPSVPANICLQCGSSLIKIEPEAAGQEQELSFESYCKLIGTGPHNEPAFTIYKTLKHHGYKITRKP